MTPDFATVNFSNEILEREAILAECNASTELVQMADLVEAHDVDGEYAELVEFAILTANQNPISETAFDVREQLAEALKEIA